MFRRDKLGAWSAGADEKHRIRQCKSSWGWCGHTHEEIFERGMQEDMEVMRMLYEMSADKFLETKKVSLFINLTFKTCSKQVNNWNDSCITIVSMYAGSKDEQFQGSLRQRRVSEEQNWVSAGIWEHWEWYRRHSARLWSKAPRLSLWGISSLLVYMAVVRDKSERCSVCCATAKSFNFCFLTKTKSFLCLSLSYQSRCRIWSFANINMMLTSVIQSSPRTTHPKTE